MANTSGSSAQSVLINICPSTTWTCVGAQSYPSYSGLWTGVLYTTVINVYSATDYWVLAGLAFTSSQVSVMAAGQSTITLSLTRIA